jgi:MFS family permease
MHLRYGRLPVLQLSNIFYLIWNTACGFSRSKSQILAFRFLSGIGGSAPLAIGGGILSDCWKAEERGKSISIYDLAPLLGPAVGPIVGSFITENTTWRWAFYATSIAGLVIQIFGLLFLKETYAPTLLQRRAAKRRKDTGNPAFCTIFDTPDKSVVQVLKTSLSRPFILLGTQPIVQVLAIYMAFLYGLMFLVLFTFPRLWTDTYHQSVGIGGLNYISIGLGSFLGTQVCAPINDYIYKKLKARNSGVGTPEFRAPLMMPGAILVPIGFFWYGWSAQAQIHWIMPDIGACILSAGIIIEFFCIHVYIIDSYTRYAASAIGATTVLRSLAGFAFPLFGSQ